MKTKMARTTAPKTMTKQKQSPNQIPPNSSGPLHCSFVEGKHREGMLDNAGAYYRALDGKIIVFARGDEAAAEYGRLRVLAVLESATARAITQRLRDAMAARRRIDGGYSDLYPQPPQTRFVGKTIHAQFASQFLPQITARVSLAKDRILLELHGGNARVRLWLDAGNVDALIFDLVRAIQTTEEFK